jgi:hypothetical protein
VAVLSLQILDIGGDMEGLDLGEFRDAVRLAPFGETAGGIEVGLARVAVVELLGEKVADTFGCFRGRREEGTGNTGAGAGVGSRSWLISSLVSGRRCI